MAVSVQISLIWLAALLYAMMPFEAYEAHGFLAAFLLLTAGFAAAVLREGQRVPRGPLVLLGLGFWGLAFVSVLLSDVQFVSFVYFCFFSVMPLSFLLPLMLQPKEEFFKAVAWVLGIAFAALGAFTIVQYFFLPEWFYNGSAHWPLADPNSFAGLFSLVFFCAVGLMLGGKDRAQSNAGLALAILSITAIFMAGSKGAVVCLAIALVMMLLLVRGSLRKHRRCLFILGVGIVLIFVSLTQLDIPMTHSFVTSYVTDGSYGTRMAHLHGTWRIIRDHFWAGTGIGTFFLYYPAYRDGDYISAGFMAHSDPLQFWSEMGVLAPLLFYGFIIAALIRTAKALKRSPGNLQVIAPFCGLAAMVAHAHINFHFNVLPTLMLSGLLLSYWYWKTDTVVYAAPLSKNIRGVGAFGVLALAFLFTLAQGSEILTNRAQDRLENGDLQDFAADINAAGRLSSQQNARTLVLASAIPLGILESRRSELPRVEEEQFESQARQLLYKAGRLNPRLPAIPYYRARLAQISPESAAGHDLPESLLRQSMTLDPMHMPSRIMLADVLAAQGKAQEALQLMKDGMIWPNATTPEYYAQLAKMAKAAGDEDLHDTAMAKMLISHGKKLSRTFQLRSYRTLE